MSTSLRSVDMIFLGLPIHYVYLLLFDICIMVNQTFSHSLPTDILTRVDNKMKENFVPVILFTVYNLTDSSLQHQWQLIVAPIIDI